MFDIALDQCGHDSSSPRFGCFAFRSYEQAEQKADEFRSMSLRRCAAVIKSLNVIYREFCEQENETPIGKDEADEPTLSSYLEEIASKQPRVFATLEDYRTRFWADNQFNGGTILFTTHAVIQTWKENFTTRLWLHPKFDPLNSDPQRELAHSFVIDQMVFDELEIDEFLDVLPAKLFKQIKKAQETYRNWRGMTRFEKRCAYSKEGHLAGVDSFDHFDRLMRLKLSRFKKIKVDFEHIPYGHGIRGKNVYQQRDGGSYHIGIREWPFDDWRIAFLTTELLTSRVVREVHKQRRQRLLSIDVPDSPDLYPLKIPVFVDSRARANHSGKQAILELASEITDANANAAVIANGAKGKLERAQTFQGCKGKNDLRDKDLYRFGSFGSRAIC